MAEKVAVVVGGSSGMGAAAAEKLAEAGFMVAVMSSSGKGEALGVRLGGLGFTGSNQSNEDLPGWIDSLPAKEERRQSVPLQRYGTAAEIGGVIAFLASEGAAYITGQNIRVDGGLMRSW